MQDKVGKVRQKYKRRHDKIEKKLKTHILKDTQKSFLESYSSAQYHKNMMILAEKKKKELNRVIDIIEQYDFYFRNLILEHLIKDQQSEKNPNLRSIIQIKFELPDVIQAMVNYDEFENQLFNTFDMGQEMPIISKIDINLDLYPEVSSLNYNQIKMAKKVANEG